jgi:prepilin-type N-terminal cleavage/methylation domain-containing protein/prepilin-type processing-associated H-X9-DG protein
MGRRRRYSLSCAFTLVELLVVIGILAVIVGILVPTLGRARSQANTALCLNNLRQLGSAMISYAMANGGVLPHRGQGVQPTENTTRSDDWFNCLPPELGMDRLCDMVAKNTFPKPQDRTIWNCPELTEINQSPYWAYGMNMWLSVWVGNKPDRLAAVDSPSTMVAFADGPGNHCSVLPSTLGYSPVARHHGFVNICFLDGHTATLAGSYVGCGIGLVEHPDIRWKVPGSAWTGPAS